MLGLKSKFRVGLDIGTHAIKIAAVEKIGPRYRLAKWKCYDLYPEGTKYDPEGPKKSVAVPALMKIMQELELQPKKIKRLASSIGGSNVAAKEIASIMQTEAEMHSSIRLEARKHIPLDGTDTVVDYQILGDDPNDSDKVRVLVIATTKKQFESHQDFMREIDLKPGIMDVEPLATLNSYIVNSQLPENGVVVFLNMGARKTNLTVFGRRDMFFTRDLNLAGYDFTKELMNIYDLEYHAAEIVKKEQGMEPSLEKKKSSDGDSLSLAEKTSFEKLGDEINRSLRYYVKETGQSVFDHFVLIGGGATLPGLDTYLSNKFNLPIELYNPFNQLDSRVPIHETNPSQFATAVGLAIRGDL